MYCYCERKINNLFKRDLNQEVTNKKQLCYNSDNNNCRFTTKNDNVVMG